MADYENVDMLTPEELEFLDDATGTDNDESDNREDKALINAEPRFPIISVSIMSVIGIMVLSLSVYILSTFAKYQELFHDSSLRQIANTDAGKSYGLDSALLVSNIYDMRAVIYIMIIVIFGVIIGALVSIWVIRHRSWEQLIMADDSMEEDDED